MKLPQLADIQPKLIDEKGFIENIVLNPEDVYMPKEEKGGNNNATRKALSQPNILALQTALKYPDWNEPLPVVKRIPGGKTINGKTYRYQLVAGYHRMTALLRNQTQPWIFALYEFANEKDELRFQAKENDKKPQNAIDHDGLVNYLTYMVSRGYIENDVNAMKAELDETFTFVHGQTKKKAIKVAATQNGAYTDVILRDYTEIKDFIDNEDNYPNGVDKYTYGGKKDTKRNAIGWTVKEGYEDEFIFNAMKSFNVTGLPSYFISHVNAPTDKMSLQDRRDNMMKTYTTLENALVKTFEYYQKNGCFPWRQEAFFPQNNVQGQEENTFIS